MVRLAFTLSLSHIYFHTFTFIPSLSHFEVRWCILDNCRDYFWSRGDDGATGSGVPWVAPAGLTSFSSECYMSSGKKKMKILFGVLDFPTFL